MDFVEGLGEASDVMEIPVDGIGRVEMFRGRLRITLTRAVERNGIIRECPTLTLVWSAAAWMTARESVNQIRNMVLGSREGVGVSRGRHH